MEKFRYKYNLVYRITNLVNGKIYIGVHSTNNLDDGYMGSGYAIKKAIKKYGLSNFKKEITHYCNNKEEALEIERTIVNHEFVNSSQTYNLTKGGKTLVFINEATRDKISKANKNHKPTPNQIKRAKSISKPVLDLSTNRVFDNIKLAAKHYNITPDNLRNHLNGIHISKTTPNFLVFKNKNDRPKKRKAKKETSISKNGGRIVKCIETGKLYGSISEVARISGIQIDSLREQLKGKKENKSGYILLGETQKRKRHGKRSIVCIKTNRVFDTIKKAAKHINFTPRRLSHQLDGLFPNQTTLRYIDSEYKKEGSRKPKCKIVINRVTNKEYASISEAAKELGLNASRLRQQLNGKYSNQTDLIYKNENNNQ